MTALHTYQRAGRYTVSVKVIDIFGNDTMTLVPVNVGLAVRLDMGLARNQVMRRSGCRRE